MGFGGAVARGAGRDLESCLACAESIIPELDLENKLLIMLRESFTIDMKRGDAQAPAPVFAVKFISFFQKHKKRAPLDAEVT